MEEDFLLDLLTYDCPITGKKRCAAYPDDSSLGEASWTPCCIGTDSIVCEVVD